MSTTSEEEKFNIRVYGILMDKDKRVLVSDEIIKGKYYTKFPGGGLEFGEGTRDGLMREFKEETGLDVEIGDHIYTTDYFQLSAFHAKAQIISIYYFVQAKDHALLETKAGLFDFTDSQKSSGEDCEVFRWIPFDALNEQTVSLPIDKIVVRLLKENAAL